MIEILINVTNNNNLIDDLVFKREIKMQLFIHLDIFT